MLGIVEAYDPASDTWTTRSSLPVERYWPAAGVIADNLYVVGGTGGDGKTVMAYNPATDTWSIAGTVPTERSYLTAGVVNGVLYAVGGYGPAGRGVSTVAAFQP
jgi:N-acetylneuraminic acid mutarotase